MKLLFDQNLSHRLVAELTVDYPDSAHVRNFGFASVADSVVWSHAATHGFVIVSKDADFQQRALLLGPPPKVIWLRLGNCPTTAIAAMLRRHQAMIREFESDPAASFIAVE